MGLFNQNYAVLQGLRKLRLMARANIFGALAGFVCSVPVFYFFREQGLAWTVVISALASAVVSLFYVRKLGLVLPKQDWHTSMVLGSDTVKLGIVMAISSIAVFMVQFVVKTYISHRGGLGDVGLYQAGWGLNEQYLGLVFTAMAKDYFPRLSQVAGDKVDEVFIGSCMTNIGHFRAAAKLLEGKRDIPTRLWVAPPTKMDASELTKEGHYGTFGTAGARMEMPGCSLCMGNQAQIRKGSTAMSTSTRNFPNRLGIDTRVDLRSAELVAVCALMGKIPTVQEYMEQVEVVNRKAADIYRYMNFDQIEEFRAFADTVEI